MITIENQLLKESPSIPKAPNCKGSFIRATSWNIYGTAIPRSGASLFTHPFPHSRHLEKGYITPTATSRRSTLSRHGFARDSVFDTGTQRPDAVDLLLKSSERTRTNYPFDFDLRIGYRLLPEGLSVHYRIDNPSTDGDDLYFSIGAHPAFKVPLQPGTTYEDYYLEFEKQETAPRWPISKEGLIVDDPQPLLDHTDRLPLSRALFAADALVLKHPVSSAITLRSAKTPHGLRVEFPGFPFLPALWAAKNADFGLYRTLVAGIADREDTDQQFEDKEGINRLRPGAFF